MIVVSDTDRQYVNQEADRAPALEAGKLSFRTCFGTVRLPGSYLIRLAKEEYPSATEPISFKLAFENWLLCELLEGVNNHGSLI